MASRLHPAALVAAATAAAALAAAPTALATFPGDNGKIAFVRDGDIWTVEPDGTAATRLTSGSHRDSSPEWSPDGRHLLFDRDGDIHRMAADGSAVARIGPGTDPQYSGDGERIASIGGDGTMLRVANADGSDARTILTEENLSRLDDWAPSHSLILYSVHDGDTIFAARSPEGVDVFWGLHDDRHLSNDGPSWSPDGTRIAFSTHLSGISPCTDEPECLSDPDLGVRVMDLGGGGLRTILPLEPRSGAAPAWSPDGTRIAISNAGTIQVIRADGSGKRTLLKGLDPDWQPLERRADAPATRTVTVTVQAPPPPPRVVEKVITRTVKVCEIPEGKRKLTLVVRASRAVKAGRRFEVTVDAHAGKATVRRGRDLGLRVHLR